MANNCDSENEGPAFSIAAQEGTSECVDLNTSGPATPCDPQACVNYFSLIKEGDGQSFIFSAGGPFELPAPAAGTTPYRCPPQVAPGFLSGPIDSGSFADPGPLAAEICMPGLPVGTYQAIARMEVRQFTPGTHVQVRYRPDCDDSTVEYLVLDYYSPCPPQLNPSAGTAPIGSIPQDQRTIDGVLVVPNTTCNPGFRLLVHTGQFQCVGDVAIPSLRNFQFELVRYTVRDVVNGGGSDLIANGAGSLPSASPCVIG